MLFLLHFWVQLSDSLWRTPWSNTERESWLNCWEVLANQYLLQELRRLFVQQLSNVASGTKWQLSLEQSINEEAWNTGTQKWPPGAFSWLMNQMTSVLRWNKKNHNLSIFVYLGVAEAQKSWTDLIRLHKIFGLQNNIFIVFLIFSVKLRTGSGFLHASLPKIRDGILRRFP